ncbi:hypothetical protein ElyMa_004538600 [Elysia marginata]|uniref:Uncharacterized protein n=1 Tax=Elysia marginata TaxID=1093978 RepID=A0AAV4HQW5_9GAST|nr:hypothetical protein ElyMa_004538600 [Elysia marginata]
MLWLIWSVVSPLAPCRTLRSLRPVLVEMPILYSCSQNFESSFVSLGFGLSDMDAWIETWNDVRERLPIPLSTSCRKDFGSHYRPLVGKTSDPTIDLLWERLPIPLSTFCKERLPIPLSTSSRKDFRSHY